MRIEFGEIGQPFRCKLVNGRQRYQQVFRYTPGPGRCKFLEHSVTAGICAVWLRSAPHTNNPAYKPRPKRKLRWKRQRALAHREIANAVLESPSGPRRVARTTPQHERMPDQHC